LVSELLNADRRYVVVGLTSRPGEEVPSLDPEEVMTLLPGNARVYFIPSGTLTCRLSDRMPKRTTPYNGAARIWMPGLTFNSSHFEHPQVYDRTGDYGPRALRVLAYGLHDALAALKMQVEFDPVAAYYELEIAQVHEELEFTRRENREKLEVAVVCAERERKLAVERAERAERRLWVAERELSMLRRAEGAQQADQPNQPPPSRAPEGGDSSQSVEASQNGV
jgi:hypothetical protein